MASTFFQPTQAMAFGKLEEANTKLTTYSLPPIIFVPPGFSPLVSEFGRGNIKEKMVNPLLVQFCHPQLWVEAVTSYNNNGEAGTISANDYIKGDSSFFFFRPLAEGTSLSIGSKEVIKEFLLKSLSQKGDPVETFKLVSVKQGNKGVDGQVRGLIHSIYITVYKAKLNNFKLRQIDNFASMKCMQEYLTAEIAYTINTEAGFLIGRKGVVSLTSVGPFIQGLVKQI